MRLPEARLVPKARAATGLERRLILAVQAAVPGAETGAHAAATNDLESRPKACLGRRRAPGVVGHVLEVGRRLVAGALAALVLVKCVRRLDLTPARADGSEANWSLQTGSKATYNS